MSVNTALPRSRDDLHTAVMQTQTKFHLSLGPGAGFSTFCSCPECGDDRVCSAQLLCTPSDVHNPYVLHHGECPMCAELRSLTALDAGADTSSVAANARPLALILRKLAEAASSATTA